MKSLNIKVNIYQLNNLINFVETKLQQTVENNSLSTQDKIDLDIYILLRNKLKKKALSNANVFRQNAKFKLKLRYFEGAYLLKSITIEQYPTIYMELDKQVLGAGEYFIDNI